jgi:hypothetical protein
VSAGPRDTALERELLRALASGADLEAAGWATDLSPERALELARDAVIAAAPDAARELDGDDLLRTVDFLLGRQSPGQAAGTVEVLRRTRPANAFAHAARQALPELAAGAVPEPPPLDPIADRKREGADDGTRAQVEAAAREAAAQLSPFREEAIEAHREQRREIKLPQFQSRMLVGALYGLMALLLAFVAGSVLYKVPVYGQATAIVTDRPAALRDQLDASPVVVAVFLPRDRRGLHEGDELRVQLPDADDRVSLRVGYVSPKVLSADEIRERFGLKGAAALAVRAPGAVAVAELRRPPGGRAAGDYLGTVAEAQAQVDRKRVVSLVGGGDDIQEAR